MSFSFIFRPLRPVTLDLEPAATPDVPTTVVNPPACEAGVEDNGDTSDDPSVATGTPVLGAPGETPLNPTGPRLGAANPLAGLSEDQLMLGRVQAGDLQEDLFLKFLCTFSLN